MEEISQEVKMRERRLSVLLSLAIILILNTPAFCEDSELVKNFKNARVLNDEKEMVAVIAGNREKIPAEVAVLLDQATAPGVTEEDKRGNFYIAELIATIYKDQFGDPQLLRGVKIRYYDTLLSPPVRPTPAGGVYMVEMPAPTETAKNLFKPDNIIIKKGETVKFVNNDVSKHILASVPFIGETGLFSSDMETGHIWEHKFEKPGAYYYFCFIHRSMLGKITVEDTEAAPAPAGGQPSGGTPAK
ncbi:MAG: hypothetical protein HY883_04080 [Deltaproteobacteria bacterium]|nr:hypothetical protein [Deltaproteobacteria bacterium]